MKTPKKTTKKKGPAASTTPAKPRKAVSKERLSDIRHILSSMMDSVPHAILGVKKRKIVFANRNVKKVFGWEPEELIGKNSRILYRNDEEYRETSERLYPALKKERVLMGEISLRHRDGSDLICFGSVARVGEELKDRMVVVTFEDITERKKNEEALIRSREELEEKVRERTSRLQKEMLGHKIASERAMVANERLRYLFGGASAVIYAAKTSGDYGATFISESVERLTGFKTDQFMADSTFWVNHVHPDDRHRVEGEVAKVFEQETSAYEYRFQIKDGTYIWVRDEMRLIRDDRGQPLEIIGYWTDISDRKKIEEVLNKESFLLREYFENMPLMAYHITFDGSIVDCNAVVLKTLGYENKDDLIGKPLIDTVYAPASREKARGLLEKWKKERTLKNEEVQVVTKGGDIRDVLLNVDTVYDEKGAPLYILSTQVDITDRKRAEEALRESEAKYRTIVENSNDAIYIHDLEGNILDVNENSCRMVGYERNELVGAHLSKIDDKWRLPENRDLELLIRNGGVVFERENIRKDGIVVPVEVSVKIIDRRGKGTVQAFVRDITERKKAEEALRESEQKYRLVLENAGEAILIAQDGMMKYVNPATIKLAGYPGEVLTSKPFTEFLHPEDRPMIVENHIKRLRGDDVPANYSFRVVDRDGSVRWVENHSTVIEWEGRPASIHFIRDITERKRAEDDLKQREQNLRSIFRAAPIGIGFVIHRVIHGVNDRFCEMLGYSRDELIGKSARMLYLSEEEFDFVGRDKYSQIEKQGVGSVETQWVRKDGQILNILLSSAPLNPQDLSEGVTFTAIDITERKQAENILRLSEHRLSELIDFLPDPTLAIDRNKRIIIWNRAMEEMTGVPAQEMIGKGDYAYTVPFYGVARPQLMDLFWEPDHVIREKYPVLKAEGGNLEIEVFCPALYGGKGAYVWAKALPLRDLEGNLIGAIEAIRDINERKKAQEAMQESEERFRLSFENANIGMCLVSMEGRLIKVNDQMSRIFGYSREELEQMTVNDIAHPDDRDLSPSFMKRSMSGKVEKIMFEKRYLHKDGHLVWGQVSSSLIRAADGTPLYFISHVQDITESKRAEAESRESRRRLADIIEFLPDATLVIDRDSKVIAWNRAIEAMTGVRAEEMLGKGNYEYALPFYGERHPILIDLALHPDPEREKQQYTTIQRTGDILFGEAYTPKLAPGNIHLSATASVLRDSRGEIIAAIECIRNNTERRRLEEQFLQAQKMEAIGTLAGGIAHDFNNLLTGILGHTAVMIADLQPSHPFYERLQSIEEFVQSGSGLTRQLLGFASRGAYNVRPTDINKLVDRTAAMFGRTRKEITIRRAFQGDLWVSEVDMAQMEQVLMNLFVNAWQAMPGGGSIYLETSNYSIGEGDSMRSYLAPGRYVKISVTDTGIGMDEKTIEKIFDPFFTTKEMGRGTGLGLATVYGIIKSHKGHITVYSELGKGSTFNIYLTASEKDVVREAAAPRAELRMGTEVILLVDDEVEIREVMKDILEMLGHEVLDAKDGDTALELYKAHRDRIDLVILDMVMPGMGGGEVFDRLKKQNPDVRVLLSSGYSINGEAKAIMDRGCRGFIQKPVSIEELSQKIKEAMNG